MHVTRRRRRRPTKFIVHNTTGSSSSKRTTSMMSCWLLLPIEFRQTPKVSRSRVCCIWLLELKVNSIIEATIARFVPSALHLELDEHTQARKREREIWLTNRFKRSCSGSCCWLKPLMRLSRRRHSLACLLAAQAPFRFLLLFSRSCFFKFAPEKKKKKPLTRRMHCSSGSNCSLVHSLSLLPLRPTCCST